MRGSLRRRELRGSAVAFAIVVLAGIFGVALDARPAFAACPTHRNGSYIGTWSTYDGSLGGSDEFDNVTFNGTSLTLTVTFTVGSTVYANETPVASATVSCNTITTGSILLTPPGGGSVPVTFDGTISPDGNQLQGTWIYGGGALSGTWSVALTTQTVLATNTTTVTTDTGATGATPTDPLQTSVVSPTPGDLSISEATASGGSQNGYQVLDHVVKIEAPTSTPDAPLSFTFELDASSLSGATADSVAVFRNGALLTNCAGPAGTASPDPCIAMRTDLPNGNVQLTVLTSAASIWSFGVQPAAITTPAFLAGSTKVPESAKVLQIPVTLSQQQTTTVSVHYVVAGLSATPTTDFKQVHGTLKFVPSKLTGLTPTIKTVNVPVFQDAVIESPEVVALTLSQPSTGTVIGHANGFGIILDSTSGTQQVYVGDTTAYEGDTGQPSLVKVPIALSSPPTSVVTVQYTITGISADGTDYTAKRVSGSVKFRVGGTQKIYVSVSIAPDMTQETDETIQVTLSNVSGASIARDVGTITIANDD